MSCNVRFDLRRRVSLALTLTVASVCSLWVASAWADLRGPQRTDRQVAQAVVSGLRGQHLSRHPLDNEISRRTFEMFFKMLDPMKVYFVNSDLSDTTAEQALGVTIKRRGNEVVVVRATSSADGSGLRPDDVIQKIGDRIIDSATAFWLAVASYSAGDSIPVTVRRNGAGEGLVVTVPLEQEVGFGSYREQIDEQLGKGDVTFAYLVFDRFLKRIDQRVALVDELLKEEHDFTLPEEMISDPKATSFAATDEEVRDRWRKRVKYDLLVKKAEKVEGDEARQKVSRRYHAFAKRMRQTKSDELLERFLTSLTSSFDPHTSYMSQKTLENFDIAMRLRLEGIGAALEYEFEDGSTKVARLIPGGPAEKDGRLKPDDRIVGVGQGLEGEILDVVDMSLNEVVELIRGKGGTVVRLKALPAAGGEPKIIEITRASIELKDSEARADIFEEGHKPNGQPYKIGVIDLPSFYMDMAGARLGLNDFKSTTRDVQKILEDFTAKGVDAVVLDLRRNGGGSLTEAISLTGLFIDEGPIVQVKDANGKVTHYDDLEQGVAWAGPLVVLSSKFSASASEIFAGAIQDYGRGLVIGDRTSHGKGTVQSLLNVSQQYFAGLSNAPQLGALKVTIQQFYRPNGESTQNRGVISDVELPALSTHLDIGEADLDYALQFDRVESAPYAKVNMIDPTVMDELRTRSTQRVRDSEEFQKVEKKINRYHVQKERKTVSLNEEKFLAERAELNTEEEEEKQFEELEDPNRPVVKRDFYFNEAIAVTLDYLQLTKLAALNGVAGDRQAVVHGQ